MSRAVYLQAPEVSQLVHLVSRKRHNRYEKEPQPYVKNSALLADSNKLR